MRMGFEGLIEQGLTMLAAGGVDGLIQQVDVFIVRG